MVGHSSLQSLQHQAGLLGDEGLVAGVADARDVTHTAGVVTLARDGQVGATCKYYYT